MFGSNYGKLFENQTRLIGQARNKPPNGNVARKTYSLRPGQTLATFQRNILQHCCMMLRQLLNELAKRTQHSSQHVTVYEPQASGTRM